LLEKTKELYFVASLFLDFLKLDLLVLYRCRWWSSTASYIAIQGFDDELTKKMISHYHGITVLGAGDGLVVLGITTQEKITN